jgi:transcriptional regulator with XRE-family HTH domain
MPAHKATRSLTLDGPQHEVQSDVGSRIPSRSVLYRLPPIAVGTPWVEGLSRYLNRLATEHFVSVSDLIELDVFSLGACSDKNRRARRRLFTASCYLMDGSESHTKAWVHALESATMQTGLHALTLLPYTRLCDGSWLRQKRAWCSQCLETWRSSRSEIYEPLIWSIRVAYRCPIHRVSLESNCRRCGQSSKPLAGASQPGYCAWCLSWLGRSPTDSASIVSDPYELWCSVQTAVMVAALMRVMPLLASDAISRALTDYLGGDTGPNRSSIAEYTGVTRRSISTWMEGTTRPRVESFFRICYALQITPLNFLGYREPLGPSERTQHEETTTEGELHVRIPNLKKRTGRPPGTHRTRIPRIASGDLTRLEQLRTALETAVATMNGVSPRDIAKQLGYHYPDRVLRRFSDLCDAFRASRHQEAKTRRVEIRQRLKRALSEWPAPTLGKLAEELKMSSSTPLRAIEPVLCDQLLRRRAEWNLDQLKRIEVLLDAAAKATMVVPLKQFCLQKGIPISLVLHRLPAQREKYDESYRDSKAEQRLLKAAEFQNQVEIAVTRILENGEFPSVGRVLLDSPELRYAGWDKITRGIRQVVHPNSDGRQT